MNVVVALHVADPRHGAVTTDTAHLHPLPAALPHRAAAIAAHMEVDSVMVGTTELVVEALPVAAPREDQGIPGEEIDVVPDRGISSAGAAPRRERVVAVAPVVRTAVQTAAKAHPDRNQRAKISSGNFQTCGSIHFSE